jgi:hypothetical protein
MIQRIRTAFTRTPKTSTTYTSEDLHQIGQALNALHVRLKEIRQLPIEDQDALYPQPPGD